jgi:DNA-binding transcriptional regulator of glucitol operon
VVRRFLTPKWLLRHALAVVLAAACVRLGIWQWDVYHGVRGGFQNLGYALQWPLFAGAVVWVWFRLIRWEIRPPERPAPITTARMVPVAESDTTRQPEPDDQPDDAHARYNRYLRSLAEKDGSS